MKPTTMPSSCAPRVGWRSSAIAKIAAKIGVPPFSRPATAEVMCCSAIGNRVNGTATQTTDRVTIRSRSSDRIFVWRRGSGSTASASAPSPTRISVMTPGGRASRPMSMNRNDAPQMTATDMNSAQSDDVNRSSTGAGVVVVTVTRAP
jgi:hypothetical protein